MNSRQRRHVLVTGGAGFIGSHLVDSLLDRDFSVTVLDNLNTGQRHNVAEAANFIEGDVRNSEDIARAFDQTPDIVCHLAGQASIRLAWANPAADLAVNVEGTLNILGAVKQHRVPRLLYASSMTVYGNPDILPTPETAPIRPVAHYGVTKFAAERYVALAGEDPEFAPAVTSFRMFNVYGPRQALDNPYQGVLAIFLGRALRGEPITIHSDGEQSRDFIFIDDICRAWVDAIDNPATFGRVFNLGSGRATTVNQLCDAVLRQFGLDRSTFDISNAPPQPGDIRTSEAAVDAVADAMNWRAETDLEKGMSATVSWARGTGSER